MSHTNLKVTRLKNSSLWLCEAPRVEGFASVPMAPLSGIRSVAVLEGPHISTQGCLLVVDVPNDLK